MALVAGVLLFAFRAAMALQAAFVLDYGEGPLLHQARMLLKGEPLYRADMTGDSCTVTNYPPLYPAAVALVGRLLGFSYATGRIVSVLATVWCGLAIFLIVRQLTGDRVAAGIAGGLFLSFPYVAYWGTLGRVDMLALAFSLSAIFAAVRWPVSWQGMGLSVLLLAMAIYTRQSYLLAAPLALVTWSATWSWRRALLFTTALSIMVVAVFVFLNWKTAGGFFFHVVVANANLLDMDQGMRMLGGSIVLAAPLIGVLWGEILSFLQQQQRSSWLAMSYLIGGSLSALTVAKVGSNVNYFLEGVAAVVLVVGMGIARWRKGMPTTVRLIPILLLTVQPLWAWYWLNPVVDVLVRRALEPEARQLEQMVIAASGPVLADEWMSMVVVSGRELLLQPFECTLLATEGKWDPRRLVADIRDGKFALILIADHPPFSISLARERWTPEMWAAIQERYEPVTVLAGATVYRPRGLRH